MAIKTIEYTIDIAGINPATEIFCGTSGDHRVTSLRFTLSDNLKTAIAEQSLSAKTVYRFEIHNSEGCKWVSDTAQLDDNDIEIELEEKHTRYGGKITVYLVISVLTADNKTEIELYSFPALLRLKNRPDSVESDSENYESLSGIAEAAKEKASDAELSAVAAAEQAEIAKSAADVAVKNANNRIPKCTDGYKNWPRLTYLAPYDENGLPADDCYQNYAIDNGMNYDKTQVQGCGNTIPTRDVRGNLWTGTPIAEQDCVTKKYVDEYHDITKQDKLTAGNGIKIDNGVISATNITDQTYNETSENAQSGKAIASALNGYYNKEESDEQIGALQYDVSHIADNIGVVSSMKQDKLTAGNNITIDENNVIDAIGYVPEKANDDYSPRVYASKQQSSDSITILTDRTDGYMEAISDEGALTDGDLSSFANCIPRRQTSGNLLSGTPKTKHEVANKKYVDDKISEISGGGNVNDVKINGTTVVENGVANIPVLTQPESGISDPGVVRISSLNYGVQIKNVSGTPVLAARSASEWAIQNNRTDETAPVFLSQFDSTLKYAMCDGKGAAWTEAEQKASRKRQGVINRYDAQLFGSVTTEEEVQYVEFTFPETKKLTYFILKIETPAVSAAKPQNIVINGNTVMFTIPSGFLNTSGKRCSVLEGYLFDGYAYADISGNSTNFTSGALSRLCSDENAKITADVTGLRIALPSETNYPIGTKIELYI